jgi:ABC-2 type transport system permease protein
MDEMLNQNYMTKTIKDHAAITAFAFLLIGALQYLMVFLVERLNILTLAQTLASRFPPQMQQFFGDELFARFSLSGAIAFGYTHPFTLVALSILAIMPAARHIAGEAGTGTLELVLALPVHRNRIFLSLWLTSALLLLIAVSGGLAGTGLAMLVFPAARTVSFIQACLIALNLLLTFLAVNGYTLLLSAYSRDGGRVALTASVITLIFYLINYLVKVWTDISFLAPLTIFNYFQPQKQIMGAAHLGQDFLILSGMTLLFGIMAARRFALRDIPG